MTAPEVAASLLHRIPEVRGLSRLASYAHRVCYRQRDPIVTAQMRLGYRMKIDLRCRTERPSYYTGVYDTALMNSARRLLRSLEAWTVLDVGANVGFWTNGLATIAREDECRLHAFEPVVSNYERLLENVNLNRLQGVVRCHNFGLSDAEAKVEISLREDFESGSETGNASIVIDARTEGFLVKQSN